jgi:hypothetical protein
MAENMKKKKQSNYSCDVLIIGGGSAGTPIEGLYFTKIGLVRK